MEWNLTGLEGRRLMEKLAARRSDRLAANDNDPDAGGATGARLPAGSPANDIAPPFGQPERQPIRKNRRRHRVRP